MRSGSSSVPAAAGTYTSRNPGLVTTVPAAENSTSCGPGAPALPASWGASSQFAVPPSRMVTVSPVASIIWLAIVRCQIRSYRRAASPPRSVTPPGWGQFSPAGRTASCASCAFLTLRV